MCVYWALMVTIILTGHFVYNYTTDVFHGEVIGIYTLPGEQITLPCDASTVSTRDPLMLLVWYKDDKPIFSYDTRIRTEWTDDSYNKRSRVTFNFNPNGVTYMNVTNVTDTDSGLYHCRVDFLASPTRNIAINVTIIVLPSQPFFLDEVGNKVKNKIGPFHEGDNLVLSCLVIGGTPPPQVRWYQNNQLIDATDAPSEIPDVRENELFLPLKREHGNTNLSCVATNNNITKPLVSSVYVELYVSPLTVEITGLADEVTAGSGVVVKCTSEGSYPAPSITWWLDHQQIIMNVNQSWYPSNFTAVSYLKLEPLRSDVNRALSCLVNNELIPRSNKGEIIYTKILNVVFPPTLEVLNVNEEQSNITLESETLHLRCDIEANPSVVATRWYYNDSKIISNGLFGNIHYKENDLIIRNISRHQSGSYLCEATNIIGTSTSQHIHIDVVYYPECSLDPTQTSAITLDSEKLHCYTTAHPRADTYLWRLMYRSNVQKITTTNPVLDLNLLPPPLDDDIKVSCESVNSIGVQHTPCEEIVTTKHLRPSPFIECDIKYIDSDDNFHVGCENVTNATYYKLYLWSTSPTNTSMSIKWRSDDVTLPIWRTYLKNGDEVELFACNRYGCGLSVRVRPTGVVLANAHKWWQGVFDKDPGLSIGIAMIVLLFIISSLVLTKMISKLTNNGGNSNKQPTQPVIQVLQLDEFNAREYLHSLERVKCCDKSCNSIYSYNSQESGMSMERTRPSRAPSRSYCWEPLSPPPDVTSHTLRESTV